MRTPAHTLQAPDAKIFSGKCESPPARSAWEVAKGLSDPMWLIRPLRINLTAVAMQGLAWEGIEPSGTATLPQKQGPRFRESLDPAAEAHGGDTWRPKRLASIWNLWRGGGVEPTSSGDQPGALPLSYPATSASAHSVYHGTRTFGGGGTLG